MKLAVVFSVACTTFGQSTQIDPSQYDEYQSDLRHYSGSCQVVEGELVCFQKPAPAGALRVACIGDSITAVGHTSSVAHHYPNQLQDILDAQHGTGSYSVTNLGVCGSTLQKEARKPWWNTGAYKTLVANRWDVVFVMLGTNDAAPDAQGYWPAENHKACDRATPDTLSECNYAKAYKELLDVIKSVGPDETTAPEVYIMIPPALMQDTSYHMNQTIINTIYPQLIPMIGAANSDIVSGVIDVYTGMGGVAAPDWEAQMPSKCVLDSAWEACKWYCDAQSCDQCHPNDVGCAKLAHVVYDGKWGGNGHVIV